MSSMWMLLQESSHISVSLFDFFNGSTEFNDIKQLTFSNFAEERHLLFAGETVVQQGSTAATLFILEHGRLSIQASARKK